MDRKQVILDFIIKCCENSSVYYNEQQAVKYLVGAGKIVFFDNTRMLDLREVMIPDYDKDVDEKLIEEMVFQDRDAIRGWESHDYRDHHYTYTLLLNRPVR